MPEILWHILAAKENGESTWKPFMDWADAYYSMKFGPVWEKHRMEFQEKLK